MAQRYGHYYWGKTQYLSAGDVNKGMKVLLLGATGLLGHNVLQRLDDEGHEVVALVRRAEGIRCSGGRWRTVVGQATDRSTLLKAAEGCEAVVNCAGTTRMDLLHLADYLPVNRDLPTAIVATMEELGIRRLVHVSTVNTIGHGTAEKPSDEGVPMSPPFTKSLYAMSKKAGEEVVLEAARAHADWHVVVINPGFMIGAWDVKPSSGQMLDAAYRKPLMLSPLGGKAFVAVADVAQAVVNALTLGQSGKRYIVTGQNLSIATLFRLQATAMGYRQTILPLPRWATALAGWVGDGMRALGVRTQLSSNNIQQLSVPEYYDSTLAHRELNIDATPIEVAIKAYRTWKEQSKC